MTYSKKHFRAFFLTSLLSLLFSPHFLTPVAAACLSAGSVYRDYNADGADDGAFEPGVANVTVTAYDTNNVVLTTALTLADGSFSLSLPDNTPARLEFSGIPSILESSRRSSGSNSTTVTFVDGCAGVSAAPVNFGVTNVGEYCHTNNPTIATSCFLFGDQRQYDPAATPNGVLVSFPYNAGDVPGGAIGQPPDTLEGIGADLGSVWGLAYQRSSDSLFASAFMKRHTGLGTLGRESTGAIYTVPRIQNGLRSPATLFFDLGAVVPTGANPHPNAGGDPAFQVDAAAWDAVGKAGLGDLDISQDDQTLYTINLFDRRIYAIPINNPAAAAGFPAAANGVASLFSPADCPNPAVDIRPFGLGVYDGVVYVGIVCTAESTQNPAQLNGFVYSFNPATTAFNRVLTIPMNPTAYPRECVDLTGTLGCPSALWNPWTPVWRTTSVFGNPVNFNTDFVVLPQPWITDIAFDNGNMVIGLRDRFGDQQGNLVPNPTGTNLTPLTSLTSGDMLRACGAPATGWVLENNGSCGGVTSGGANQTPAQGLGGGEYYFQDNHVFHSEIGTGGVMVLAGSGEALSTVIDPGFNDAYDAGVQHFSNANGTETREYRVVDGDLAQIPPLFGKANGLSTLEAFCGPAPLEIGNRVWFDPNRNGVQDADRALEFQIPGVVMSLWTDIDANGTLDLLAQTTTDSSGEYYFNENAFTGSLIGPRAGVNFLDINSNGVADPNEPRGIMPNRVYEVRIDAASNFAAGGPLANYFITATNASPDMRDSDGTNSNPAAVVSSTNFPFVRLTSGNFGQNNHTYDFGFVLAPVQQPTLTPPPPGTPGTPGPQPTIVQTPGAVGTMPSIFKTVDLPFAARGATVTWTITLHNPNSFPLTNVTMTDIVPSEVDIIRVSATAGNVSYQGRTVTFTQAVMDPGATTVITIVTRVRDDAPLPFVIVNSAGANSNQQPNVVTSSASASSARRLPATGETPATHWPLVGAMLLVVLWLVRRLAMRWQRGT